MRIALYANPILDRGVGVSTYCTELARHLPQVAPNDDFVLFYNSFKRANEAGPALHALAKAPNLHVQLNLGLKRAIAKAWRWGFPPVESFTGPLDVYHGTNCFSAPTRHARRVVTIHDLTPLLFPQWHTREVRGYANELRRTIHQQDLILTISDATKQDLERCLEVPASRIRVIPLAAAEMFRPPTPEEIRGVRTRLGLQRPYVLHTGTLEPRKNLVRLLEAFSRTTDDHDLVLVGTKGWLSEDIHASIERLKLSERVRITGYVDSADLPAVYAGADVFCYPSMYEGFGLPPLEAMACGTPVITSQVSSLPEVVGDAALLIDPHDVESLSESLNRLLSDQALQKELRQRGLARAKRFSWERTARETASAYREVCAR